MWECRRAILAKKPRVLILENVKGLVGKKFKGLFDLWCKELKGYGYTNYWRVLNAKDYGVPQNRERVFLVSILGDHDTFLFPKPLNVKKCINDIKESNVEEKYYLSDKTVKSIIEHCEKKQKEGCGFSTDFVTENDIVRCISTQYGSRQTDSFLQVSQDNAIKQVGNIVSTGQWDNPQRGRVYSCDGISPALNTRPGGGLEPKILEIPQATRKGYIEVKEGGVFDWSYPNSKLRRGRVQGDKGDVSPALTCNSNNALLIFEGAKQPDGKINKDQPSQSDRICEPISCAIRGRKNKKGKYIQTLEIGNKTSNCLTSIQKDSMIMEVNIKTQDTYNGTKCLNSKVNGKQPSLQDRVHDTRGCSTAITTSYHPSIYDGVRLRKFTPKECFRLMGVSDGDIAKIQGAGISNTQQYKMVGNSIVVDVLDNIFEQLFYPGDEVLVLTGE